MSQENLTKRLAAVAALVTVAATPAGAHVGVGDVHGLSHGLLHPFAGLDHVLAMVAVGMLAANLGGRALWLMPATFVLMMALSGALGVAQVELPYVEVGIAMSVIVFGLAVALPAPSPMVAALAVVGFFAIFHGHAHGAEMPADAAGASYAAGFMIATVLLHATGIGIGLGARRVGSMSCAGLNQVGGGAMALAGFAFLTGWL